MPAVTEYFGIPGNVPFADLDVSEDNRMYVDPHAIRLSGSPQPYAQQAIDCLDTFLGRVTDSVVTDTSASHQVGEGLLQRFSEPWETRCGMSSPGSFHGRGGASHVGSSIWDVLIGDAEAVVRVGVLKHLEDLPLFVPGVDRDITSDITTRIVFLPLAKFTQAMMRTYPQFTAGGNQVIQVKKQVWDPANQEWVDLVLELPTAAGHPLLLVPKQWVRTNLLMSARRYYSTSVLTFAQLKKAVTSPDGKLYKPQKRNLRTVPGLKEGRDTNIRVTLEALEDQEDLLAAFKIYVASKFDADGSAA